MITEPGPHPPPPPFPQTVIHNTQRAHRDTDKERERERETCEHQPQRTPIGEVPADVPLGAAELDGVDPAVDALQFLVGQVRHDKTSLNSVPFEATVQYGYCTVLYCTR